MSTTVRPTPMKNPVMVWSVGGTLAVVLGIGIVQSATAAPEPEVIKHVSQLVPAWVPPTPVYTVPTETLYSSRLDYPTPRVPAPTYVPPVPSALLGPTAGDMFKVTKQQREMEQMQRDIIAQQREMDKLRRDQDNAARKIATCNMFGSRMAGC